MANMQGGSKKEAIPTGAIPALGAVSCWTFNTLECNLNIYGYSDFCGGKGVRTTLYRAEEIFVIITCELGEKIVELSSGVYRCKKIGWNDYYLKQELEQVLPFEYGNSCDSCSGDLCVKNSECAAGQIRCTGETTFNSCETISHQYFVPFQKFSGQVQSCPSGYTCSQEQNNCIPNQETVCNNLKSVAINLINQWANNPSQDNKGIAINTLSQWAEAC